MACCLAINSKIWIMAKKNLMIATIIFVSMNMAKLFAQPKKLGITINMNEKTEWYLQPWFWAAAAVILALLTISALRSFKR